MISSTHNSDQQQAPDGMMVELLQGPAVMGITNSTPEFGWIVHSSQTNDTAGGLPDSIVQRRGGHVGQRLIPMLDRIVSVPYSR
jgi:hypothetical protein